MKWRWRRKLQMCEDYTKIRKKENFLISLQLMDIYLNARRHKLWTLFLSEPLQSSFKIWVFIHCHLIFCKITFPLFLNLVKRATSKFLPANSTCVLSLYSFSNDSAMVFQVKIFQWSCSLSWTGTDWGFPSY